MTTSLPRRWYLAKEKQRLGPFAADQLRQMAATGMIQHSDMTLEEGQTKWQVAGTIEGIWPQALPLCPPRPDAITCPSCKTPVSYNGRLEGQAVCCPRCKSNFRIQGNAISIPNNASPKDVDNVTTPSVPRKRGVWNGKTIGIVTFTVVATMLVLFVGFWSIGNRRIAEPTVEHLTEVKTDFHTETRLEADSTQISREHVEMKKDDRSTRHTDKEELPPPTGNKKEGMHPSAKNEKPQPEKPRGKRTPPPVELSDLVKLGKALAKAKQDEFYLFDLNKGGIHSFFSAANSQVTSQVGDAQIVEYKMCIIETKYDFDTKSFNVVASRWITITHHPTSYGVLLPDYYLAFSIPAQADEAREWSQMFKQKKLTLDVTFRVRGFRKVSQPDTSGGTLMNDVVETTVITARLGSTK